MAKISGVRSRAALLLAFAAMLLIPSTHAQIGLESGDAAAPEASAELNEPISAAPPQVADEAIATRITGIFDQIEELAAVSVAVTNGVVTLGGPVEDPEIGERAVSIAQRVSGVATVETRFERDISIDGNVSPLLQKFQKSIGGIVDALPLLAIAFAVAIAIALVGRLLASFTSFWRRITPNIFLAELIAVSVKFVFLALGIFVALDILNATAVLGAVLGGAGVIGLAIGFAMRDTVDNYVSSVMLSVRQPFRANDHVEIGEHEGHVIRLTSRATILMTLDGNHLRIPNSTVFKSEILNYTTNPQRRFNFELGVDADDDPAAAVETGLATMRDMEFILNEPPATAEILNVGDSNIVIVFRGWVDQKETDFRKARGAAIRETKIALEEAGFALPEPIYRLRFDDMPQAIKAAADRKNNQPERTDTHPPDKRDPGTASSLDVSREDHVVKLVDAERSTVAEEDLLNANSPSE